MKRFERVSCYPGYKRSKGELCVVPTTTTNTATQLHHCWLSLLNMLTFLWPSILVLNVPVIERTYIVMIPTKSFPTSTCPLSCQTLPYLNLPLTPKKYPRAHVGIDVHKLQ